VGLCDLLPERLTALGDEIGVEPRFSDLDRMIEATEPEIVVIATGTEYHHALLLRVLEHGVHVDVEKPICVDLVQADEVLGLAERKGVRIAVHHQGRTGASLQAVARAIADGKIGEIVHVAASGKGYYGGYGLMNIGTHLVNGMLAFTGHCTRVIASALTGGHPVSPADVVASPSGMGTIAGEHITATLEFRGGLTATLQHHRFEKVDSTAYGMEVRGSRGRLFWKTAGAWFLEGPHYVPAARSPAWVPLDLGPIAPGQDQSSASPDDYAYTAEYVDALDAGREHMCSGGEGRHVLEVLMGIFESAACGGPVDLPQEHRGHPLLGWRERTGLDAPRAVPRAYADWLSAEDARIGR